MDNNIQGKSGRVTFPRVKVVPAIPATPGRAAEAPARRAPRVEERKRDVAMMEEYTVNRATWKVSRSGERAIDRLGDKEKHDGGRGKRES